MNPKEILLKEMSERVGDKINEQTIIQKVNQFLKYGNVFLFFEIMSLRKEIEKIKEEIEYIRDMTDAGKLKIPI